MKKFEPQSLKVILDAEVCTKGGKIVCKSIRTGKDLTYKIRKKQHKEKWYVGAFIEVGYNYFRYIGTYYKGELWKNNKPVDTISAKGIAWILRNVEQEKFDKVNSQVELMHTGNCIRCNRTLTDATSIENGLGPTCIKTLR